ncbi:MAG: DUF1614 domain-containing protein [Halobacteria archaeon]
MAFEAVHLRRFPLLWWLKFEGYEPNFFLFAGLLLLIFLPAAPLAAIAAAAGVWLASGFDVQVPGSFRTRKPALSAETASFLEKLHGVPVAEPLAKGERTYRTRLALNLGTALFPVAFLVYLVWSGSSTALASLATLIPVVFLTVLLGKAEPGVGILLPPYAALAALPITLLLHGGPLMAMATAGIGVMVGSLVLVFSVKRDEPGAPVYRIGGKGSGAAVVLTAILALLL